MEAIMSDRGAAVLEGKYGLEVGTPPLESAGPLAFGPEGILFVADNSRATIFAIDLGDAGAPSAPRPLDVDKLDTRLAAYLGCDRADVHIRDMAVHPTSQEVYLSVMRGGGAAATPVLIKVGVDGALSEVNLEGVPFAQARIEDAPAADDPRVDGRVVRGENEGEELVTPSGVRLRIAREGLRTVTVTDLAYVDGALLVAGASNEEFSSTLRRIPFPFRGEAESSSLEIFHVSHGRYETASPIRTFVPYAGKNSILASYTCTPVVRFNLDDLESGAQVKGQTVAELGAMNTPIDILSYTRDGEEYLLVSNTRHPLIKIAAKDIDRQEALTQPKEPVGAARETLPQAGVGRMANLNGGYVIMMQQDDAGDIHLRSYRNATL
jgi:hypothetical protein